jgi:hypothetical protein
MGYPTHMFVYSQIGFLNAYSGSGHDYRVLTTPGPGAPLTGGEVEGPYRLVANPNDPEAEEDWGYNVRFRHVPLPRSGEGETWQIRGPGWAAIAPANLTSDENRLQVQVEPGGLYEGEFSLYRVPLSGLSDLA